jgi:hypothetical protein
MFHVKHYKNSLAFCGAIFLYCCYALGLGIVRVTLFMAPFGRGHLEVSLPSIC